MRWRKHITALLLVSGLAQARAQTLDLDVPEPPPGADAVHLVIADQLQQEAAELRMNSVHREDSAQAALRELAVALIERGLRRSEQSSELLIAGRTLAAGLAGLDPVLVQLDELTRLTIAADARRLAATLLADPEAADRAIRDSLAPLLSRVGLDPNAGWLGLQAPAPSGTELRALIDHEPVSSAPGLLRLIEEARNDPAYRPAADRLARRLRDAAGVLTPPAWVAANAQRALEQRFTEAARQAHAGNGVEAAIGLDQLAQLDRLLRALDTTPVDADLELSRAQAEALIVTPGPRAMVKVLMALRMLEAASRAMPPEPSTSFVRELRPAWAALRDRAEEKQLELQQLIPVALRTDTSADPGMLAAIAAVETVFDRFAGLNRLNDLLKQGLSPDSPPVAHRDQRPLAMQAGKMARDDNTHLWDLTEQVTLFATLPGEAIWSDATRSAPWIREIDILVPEMIENAAQLREAWTSAWADENRGGPAADELEAGRRLLRVLDAIHTARSFDQSGWALANWSGWHHPHGMPLAPGLVPFGLNGDGPALSVLVAAWTDPLTPVDFDRLKQAERDFSAVLAVVQLERQLRAAGRVPGGSAAASSPATLLTELGLGTPDASLDPLAAYRDDIAELNRRVLEAVALAEDDTQADQARGMANQAAEALLDRWPR